MPYCQVRHGHTTDAGAILVTMYGDRGGGGDGGGVAAAIAVKKAAFNSFGARDGVLRSY